MKAAELQCCLLSKWASGLLWSQLQQRKKQQNAIGAAGFACLFSQQQQQRLSATIDTVWARTFAREHCRLLVDLVHLNRHFASPLIFAFYTPIIAASVYVLCLLYFLPGELLLKLYLVLDYLGLFLTSVFLVCLSVIVRVLYDPVADSQLFRAQMLLRGGRGGGNGSAAVGNENGRTFLRTKLKLMSYYEVMRTEKKVAFTFGSHAKVEYTWLWEVQEKSLFLSVLISH